ncbi:hypothetical protein CYY_010365 [Polysphondylium violaceum]|uniref:Lipase maturation factor 2 n=1 Tax=Polysphondylium violaceum TaxID=133409 RepID=A0A8J4UTW7_9MYCE|nr:hypothetical protein CYY_010365 [Polysphondylium violaceum]
MICVDSNTNNHNEGGVDNSTSFNTTTTTTTTATTTGSSSPLGTSVESLTDYITKKNKKKSIKEHQRKKSYFLSTWLFLKILSTVTFIAFFSAVIQVKGLIGDDGILPVSSVLEAKVSSKEINSIWILFIHPTKGMGWSVNDVLHGLCCVGLIFSSLSLFMTTTATYIGIMWFCYYCIVDVGQVFYSYQWDQLLLETLFLAIFFSPFNHFKYDDKPSTPIRYLLKWLLFRLMFGSGLVKLTPIWAGLQAMIYHYETQCIPNVFSWYFHQLPPLYHQFETMMVLAIEILLPPLYFAPRLFRIFASLVTIVFQLGIALTGNYNFFNYLTMGLCVLLLDDAFLLGFFFPGKFKHKLLEIESKRMKSIQQDRQADQRQEFSLSNINSKNLLVPFVFILVGTSSLYNTTRYFQKQTTPLLITRIHSALSLYHLTGTYGLFSHVSVERFEIIIEGSYDGETWSEYEFYYKPGNLSRHPPFVFPGHKPRLDWQMWFAALSKDYRSQPWLIHFMARLLQGTPEVHSLIEYSPFPLDKPPLYIRAQKYKYYFTKWKGGNIDIGVDNDSQWWSRDLVGTFVNSFSLDSLFYKSFILQNNIIKEKEKNNMNN